MDLEFITLSEVRQTEKDKYGITYRWDLKKRNDTNALIYLKEIKYGFQRGKVRG